MRGVIYLLVVSISLFLCDFTNAESLTFQKSILQPVKRLQNCREYCNKKYSTEMSRRGYRNNDFDLWRQCIRNCELGR